MTRNAAIAAIFIGIRNGVITPWRSSSPGGSVARGQRQDVVGSGLIERRDSSADGNGLRTKRSRSSIRGRGRSPVLPSDARGSARGAFGGAGGASMPLSCGEGIRPARTTRCLGMHVERASMKVCTSRTSRSISRRWSPPRPGGARRSRISSSFAEAPPTPSRGGSALTSSRSAATTIEVAQRAPDRGGAPGRSDQRHDAE